jgi:hypothetical protein
MIEYQSANPSTGLFAGRAAGWFGWAILAALAAVILLISQEHRRRTPVETYEELTSVGDHSFFKMPEQAGKNPVAAVIFRGQPLYPAGFHRLRNSDTKMLRAGSDDSGALRIYMNSEPDPQTRDAGAKKSESDYYLKLGEDEYLNVRPGKP